MQLDKLQAELRPRSAFESVDLGFAMVRRWWKPTYLAWLVAVSPWFALVWVLLHDHPFWAFLALWWLKPMYDRVPLLVLSRALFDETPDLRAVLRSMPRLWWKGSLLSLLLFRLDPMRSFFLPVLQLEGIYGRSRSRRRSALLRTMGAPAAWLTFACLCLEVVIIFGLFGFLVLLLPDRPDYAFGLLVEQIWDGTAPAWLMTLLPVLWFLALSAVEPLYVGGGFALYLNRRTRLEGWDVELVFRRMAERLRRGSSGAARAAVILLAAALLLAASWLAPGQARAQSVTDPPGPSQTGPSMEPPSPEEAAKPPLPGEVVEPAPATPRSTEAELGVNPEAVIERVLDRPEFRHRERQMVWRPREREEEEQRREPRELPSFMRPLAELLAMGVEGLMWAVAGIVLAGLILFVVSRLRGRELRGGGVGREPLPGPKVGLAGEDGAPLPPDIPAAAARLWDQGRYDEALGLLYRGALVHLVEARNLAIEEGATEGDCLRVVRRGTPPELFAFFSELTRAWQEVAYAHRTPARERFHGLCQGWPAHFGGAA